MALAVKSFFLLKFGRKKAILWITLWVTWTLPMPLFCSVGEGYSDDTGVMQKYYNAFIDLRANRSFAPVFGPHPSGAEGFCA
jgi:hypothetical protein